MASHEDRGNRRAEADRITPARPTDSITGLSRREILVRGAAGIGAMNAAWLLAACSSDNSSQAPAIGGPAPEGGGQEVDLLTWAIDTDPTSMDYAFTYDYATLTIVPNITESLLRFDVDGHLIPNLADSWRQVDDVTYSYSIRKNVQFHDGTTLTPDDVVFSLDRHRDPKVGSYLGTFYQHVKRIEKTGSNEVTVTLTQPDALWKYAVATTAGAITSRAFVERAGSSFGKPKAGTLGTGPYKFVSWAPGQETVIERFDDYWNTERPLKVGRVVVRVLKDPGTTISALSSGEIDGSFALAGRNLAAAQKAAPVYVASTPGYGLHYLAINTQMPPFDDPRVRQALSYAVDKPGMLESVWGGAGQLTRSPATEPMWTFEQDTFQAAYDELPAFEQDIDKAKELISEAGASGTKATMLLSVPFEEQLGVAVQAAAKEIGLDLTIEKLPQSDKYAQEFSGKATRPYALSISQWASDVPDPAGTLWFTFYSKNRITDTSAYHDPETDRLLARQLESSDDAERAELLTAAQSIIVEAQPWITFYSPDQAMVCNEDVAGYEMSPLWQWDSWAADLSGTSDA